jgi:DNA-binding transcriptional MerR regulator
MIKAFGSRASREVRPEGFQEGNTFKTTIKGGIQLNINEISKKTGLPYSSTRKYLVLLEEAGFFKSKVEEGARVFPDEAASLIARLSRLSSDGVPLKEGIERLKGGDLEEKKQARRDRKETQRTLGQTSPVSRNFSRWN